MPRNVSGTYTLPLPPVVPNTVIQAAWANTTENDIAQAITDSLDRNGRGGMIAPFRLIDGTVSQPAFAFSSETGTGLYRASAGVMGVAVMGVEVGQWSSAGYSGNIAGNTEITGNATVDGTLTVVGGILAENGLTSLDDIGVLESFNGDAGFFVTNNSSGTLATSIFNAVNSSGQRTLIGTTSSGYTGLPAVSVTGLIFSNATQGLALMASAASSNIRFMPGGTAEIARFTTNGLGIGTSPVTTGIHLDVIGTIRGQGGAGAGGAGVGIRLVDSTGFSGGSITVPEGSATGLSLSGDGGPMAFLAGGSQRMLITAAGLVGINRTPTGKQFEVGGGLALVNGEILVSTSAGGDLRLGYESYTTNASFNLWTASNVPVTIGSGGAERMRVDYNGTVTIGRAATPPAVDGLLQLFNATRVPKLALIKTSVQGWYLGADSASTGSATQLFNIFANGGPLLTINPGTGWIGLSSGDPGQSFFQLTQPGYDGNPKQFSAAGPYGNFMNFYGGSMSNGGGVVELNGHTSVSSLASWQMLHHSDIAANDLLFRYAPTQTSRAALVYTERFRVNINGVASVTQSGGSFVVAADAGPAASGVPVGTIVFGQATLPGGSAALTGLGTFVCSGSNPISWGGYTGGSSTSITFGTWRNIGAQTTSGVGLWMRVA